MLCYRNRQRVERDPRNNHNQGCAAECLDNCPRLRRGRISALPRGIADRPPYNLSRAGVPALIWRLVSFVRLESDACVGVATSTFVSNEPGVVDGEHHQQHCDICQRREEFGSSPSPASLCAEAIDGMAEEQRSRNNRGGQISAPGNPKWNKQKRHGEQGGGIGRDVETRP